MATKKPKKGKGRKLKLSKETLKDLTTRGGKVKGGLRGPGSLNDCSF